MHTIKYKVITSLEEVKHIDPTLPTFADIETEGLYIGVRLVQLYQPDTSEDIYILDTDKIPLQDIKDFIKPLWTVWYNASYDFGTLNMTTDKFDDLFYLVKTAFPSFQQYNLDLVISRLGYDSLYEGLDKKTLQKQGFVRGAYLSAAQLRYAATDVFATSLIWKLPAVQKGRDIIAYKVDILSLKYAVIYQQHGLAVDEDRREELIVQKEKEIEELRPLFPDGFNPNSYIQVRKYLGTDQSNYEALVMFAATDNPKADKAEKLIKLKKSMKELSYLKSIRFPVMYTKFNPAGAITGRFTSNGGDLKNGFNAQQIPRAFQPLFKADTEDTEVLGLDYSTLELRIACSLFGDPTMYEELMAGKDLHTEMAILATGKKLHEDGLLGSEYDTILDRNNIGTEFLTTTDRTLAKSINFGYVFGMSAERYTQYAYISYGIKVSPEKSQELKTLYFAKYPMFAKYHKNVWNHYKEEDYYYETALGRRVKPKMGTDGINGPVQGSGAETTKLAVHYLIKEYPDALNYIFNVVHDAIYLRVPKGTKDMWKKRLEEAMKKGWTEISKTPAFKYKDIPMPVGD